LYTCWLKKLQTQCLQQDLDKLTEWAHTWLMEFNIKKCEHLRITNKRNPIIHNYHLENSIISEVPYTKMSGGHHWPEIIMEWTYTKDHQQSKPYQWIFINVLFMLRIIVISGWFAPLLNTHPLSSPSHHTNIHQLESIQRRADRFCYNDFSRFSSVTRMMSSLNLPRIL